MSTSRRMRLLVVAQPLVAGVPHHVMALLPAILAAGWQVTVACPRTSILWTEAERLGLDRVPTNPRRAPGLADVPDLIRLLRLCRRADVIHAHSSKSGLVARLAATLAGRRNRCVFTPHGWSFWALDGTAGRLAVALERIAAHGCARIIAVSTFEREAGLTGGIGPERRFRVVPNGVPDPRPEGSSVDARPWTGS